MKLIVDSVSKVFDTSEIEKGYLIFAKHRTWPDGKAGFVTAVNDKRITVQYHPGIANVTNHFSFRRKRLLLASGKCAGPKT